MIGLKDISYSEKQPSDDRLFDLQRESHFFKSMILKRRFRCKPLKLITFTGIYGLDNSSLSLGKMLAYLWFYDRDGNVRYREIKHKKNDIFYKHNAEMSLAEFTYLLQDK